MRRLDEARRGRARTLTLLAVYLPLLAFPPVFVAVTLVGLAVWFVRRRHQRAFLYREAPTFARMHYEGRR